MFTCSKCQGQQHFPRKAVRERGYCDACALAEWSPEKRASMRDVIRLALRKPGSEEAAQAMTHHLEKFTKPE